MPVTTRSPNRSRQRVPRVADQPVSGGNSLNRKGLRYFSQPMRSRKSWPTMSTHLHEQVAGVHLEPVAIQGSGRRTGQDAAVPVKDAAMAGTAEAFPLAVPLHDAAQVRTARVEAGDLAAGPGNQDRRRHLLGVQANF